MSTLSKAHENLINAFLKSKGDDIRATTKTAYINSFTRLIKLIFKTNKQKSILTINIGEVFKILETAEIPTNSKIDLLKTYKYIYEFKKKSSKPIAAELLKYFNTLDNKETNKKLLEDLITYAELMKLYNKLEGVEYLLYYLIINFNVRNMDLIIFYTNKPDEADKKDINLLHFNNEGNLIYTRNNYKTARTYGQKTHIIKDNKFIKILKGLKINEYIFKNRTGKPRTYNEMNKYISSIGTRYGVKGMNQQNIYKIILNNTNDYNEMTNRSTNRGHSLTTQGEYYT
jgi:hypothetical protein